MIWYSVGQRQRWQCDGICRCVDAHRDYVFDGGDDDATQRVRCGPGFILIFFQVEPDSDRHPVALHVEAAGEMSKNGAASRRNAAAPPSVRTADDGGRPIRRSLSG